MFAVKFRLEHISTDYFFAVICELSANLRVFLNVEHSLPPHTGVQFHLMLSWVCNNLCACVLAPIIFLCVFASVSCEGKWNKSRCKTGNQHFKRCELKDGN